MRFGKCADCHTCGGDDDGPRVQYILPPSAMATPCKQLYLDTAPQ